MNLFSSNRISRFTSEQNSSSQNAVFNLSNYRRAKNMLESIWQDTALRARQRGDNLIYFPFKLLKQQSQDYAKVCKNSYSQCEMDELMLLRIQEIEAEIMALNGAYKWLNHEIDDNELANVKAIFIALDVIFTEFKDNKNTDCDCRVPLFIEQIVKLLAELSEVLNSDKQ